MNLRHVQRLLLTLGLALVLAACGSPTAEDPEGQAGQGRAQPEQEGEDTAPPEAPGSTVESVLNEVEGLEGEERRRRLAELSSEAGEAGTVNLYTSNLDAAELAETFTDDYGIEVSVYRATGDVVLQRLIQEAAAGFQGADVVEMDMRCGWWRSTRTRDCSPPMKVRR
ncbi:MAG: hypothetical protein GEU81_16015 [Nitriliruptorales bacterium]|nr:hypothetical protein [Nitriliruptorales bacterium]